MTAPAPTWFTVVLRRTKRLARGALRRLTGRGAPPRPAALVGPQLARTGLHRYDDYQEAGAQAPPAALGAAREVLGQDNLAGALRLGYTLVQSPATYEVGRAVLGLAHLSSSTPAQAWVEFAELTRPEVIAAASPEFFVAGFALAPQEAAETATRLLQELGWPDLTAGVAVVIARHALSAGWDDIARDCLAAAESGRLGPPNDETAELRSLIDRDPDPGFGPGDALRFHAGMRPLILSFHVADPGALTPDVIEHLRQYAPIGCRDWQTVALVRAAGVDAFLDQDEDAGAMRQDVADRAGSVLATLASGADEAGVVARWRDLCAPDVERAARFLGGFELTRHALPQPSVPAPLEPRLVIVDAPYRSERGVQALLESLAEHAPDAAVVVVGPGGEHAEPLRWVRDLPVPERGSAQQQQALMVASVLDALPTGVRVLLLPADAVVRGPLEGLFALELHGAALAARADIRRGRQDLSTLIRRISARQGGDRRDTLTFLAAAQARCGHGGTTFDARVAVIDPDALAAAGFTSLARELIDDYGASLNETLNVVLAGRHADLLPTDHSNAALERPAPGATVISGLAQARMGAHWFS